MPRPPTPVPFIQTGDPAMDRLQRFVAQALPGKQDPWSAPKLLTSWVNFDPATYSSAGFMKDSMGFVHLRGLVKSGALPGVIFNLPTGYRPAKHIHFAIASSGAFGYASADPSGDVRAEAGSNVWFDLNGIAFDTR